MPHAGRFQAGSVSRGGCVFGWHNHAPSAAVRASVLIVEAALAFHGAGIVAHGRLWFWRHVWGFASVLQVAAASAARRSTQTQAVLPCPTGSAPALRRGGFGLRTLRNVVRFRTPLPLEPRQGGAHHAASRLGCTARAACRSMLSTSLWLAVQKNLSPRPKHHRDASLQGHAWPAGIRKLMLISVVSIWCSLSLLTDLSWLQTCLVCF